MQLHKFGWNLLKAEKGQVVVHERSILMKKNADWQLLQNVLFAVQYARFSHEHRNEIHSLTKSRSSTVFKGQIALN